MLAGYWHLVWYIQYVIFKIFLRVDLKLNTVLFFCFVFVSFWTHILCFTCNIETWQSLSVGWAWLSDCFSRLSPNLCWLFQALSIEMCFTAEYLQRKHDLTWLSCYRCHGQLSRTCVPNLSCDYFNQSSEVAGVTFSPTQLLFQNFWFRAGSESCYSSNLRIRLLFRLR